MSLNIEIAKKKMEELRSFPAKKGQPILRQISSKKIKILTWSPTVPGIRYFLWESWRILPTSTSSEYSELSLIRPRWYRATPVLNPWRKSFETVVFASWENWKYPYFLHSQRPEISQGFQLVCPGLLQCMFSPCWDSEAIAHFQVLVKHLRLITRVDCITYHYSCFHNLPIISVAENWLNCL